MKSKLIESFKNKAFTYDEYSYLQREVNSRLSSRLSLIKHSPEYILDIGSGTGELSLSLHNKFPNAHIYSSDICIEMLEIHKNKKDQSFKIVADAEALPFREDSFDTVLSSLTFHWCKIDEYFFSNFLKILKPGGLLLFSAAGPNTLREFRECSFDISSKLELNHFLDMHHYGDYLLKSAFDDPVVDSETIIVQFSSFNSLMDSLRKTGTNFCMSSHKRNFISKTEYKDIKSSTYNSDKNCYELTFEIIFGYAIKLPKNPIKPGNLIEIKEVKKE